MAVLRDQVVEWLSKQPVWQQDLARRLADRAELTGDAYGEAFRVVRGAFGALDAGERAPASQPLVRSDLPSASTEGAPRLLSIGQFEGVGAISSRTLLRFAPTGLTIVFGANAVGKTSYVRALKRICRTVDRDAEVRGNVFAVGPKTSSAVVTALVGEDERESTANLRERADLGLDSVSVFDAACAELYVDGTNSIAFIPADLRLLARLASAQNQMRDDLEGRMRSLRSTTPVFADLETGTRAQELVERLSATMPASEVKTLASLEAADRLRLTELQGLVAAAITQTASADAGSARHDAEQAMALANELRQLTALISSGAWERANDAATVTSAATAAVRTGAAIFSELPIDAIGGESWKRLWDAARAFAVAVMEPFPPEESRACPLCLTPVSASTADALRRFEEFVTGTLQDEADTATGNLAKITAALDADRLSRCRGEFLRGLKEREAGLYAQLTELLGQLETRFALLRREPEAAFPGAPDTRVLDDLERWAGRRRQRADTLTEAADADALEKLQKELADLEGRAVLEARLPEILDWLKSLERLRSLGRARSALATNKITIFQGQLAKEVVTAALDESLRSELQSMRCAHLPVNLRPSARMGTTLVKLRLSGISESSKISDIASEGEHRALSLAFFLAELALADGDGGIVVDDPVSSLDEERRVYIAGRLVEEAERRQVIVFTHDLPFMLDLVDQARAVGLDPAMKAL